MHPRVPPVRVVASGAVCVDEVAPRCIGFKTPKPLTLYNMDSQCTALVGPHHHDTARHVQQFSVLVIALEYRLCAWGGVRCGLCRCNGPALHRLQGVSKCDYLVNSLNGASWE